MIDITIKLISEESVKMFDKLAINPLRILPHPEGSRLTACVKRQLVLDTLIQNVALLVLN